MKLLYKSDGFRRLDFGAWLSVGIFIGRANYLKGRYGKGRGIELFAFPCRKWPGSLRRLVDWHVGLVKDWRWAIDYSGSNVDPWHSFTIRVGWLGIGATSPQWLKRRKASEESCSGSCV